jgi:E3 ubiquitin-protein ligase SHPRH
VRALPAGLALLELMAPRAANATGPTTATTNPSAGGRAASAFALRHANMHSFEADRQAWRGTSREYADAGGADLAHKLADVADGVLKILRNAAERHRRGDADAAARADRVPGVAALLTETATRREAARARLHRLQHAFPGRLTKLCACAGWTCGCKASPAAAAAAPAPSCCASAAAFAELSRADNRAARAREATEVASAADAAARDAVAAARAPLPKLRWLLAVELVTSGAAFERFRAAAQKRSSAEAEASRDRNAAGRGGRDADEETDDPRKRMSFRFLRRAFLAARLDGLVASADAAVEAARAVAQDRDPADPNGKPRRAINRAPEDVQEAYRVAVAAARDARVRRRDETPEGVRFSFPKTDGGLLERVVPRLANEKEKNVARLSARAALDALYEAVDRARARANLLAEEIGALAPYMRALASAASSTDFVGALPDVGTVKQGGFALIDEISKGKTVPQCCICCAPARLPTITRCMHLACARCVVTWFHAAPMHGAAAAAGGAPCPLCRKPFQIEELIRLLPNEEAFHDKDAREGEKTRPAGEDAERVDVKGKGAKTRARDARDTRSKRRSRQKRKDANAKDAKHGRRTASVQLGADPRVVRAAAFAFRRGPKRPPRRAVPRAVHGRRPFPRARAPRVRAAEPEDRRARGGPAFALREIRRLGQSRGFLAAKRRPRQSLRGAHLGGIRERAGGRKRY